MGNYIGAIDQGTTSSRFMVFDRSGKIVSVAQKEHEQIYPKPGWVEHDPAEIWLRVTEVINEAMEAKGLKPEDLAAIGITNQRETTVVWNKKTGKAVYNAIVWQDTRVGDTVAEFAADGGQDRYRAKTGLPLATYFSGLKIRWILNNVAGARAAAEAGELLFGNIDTFLIWNLTGGVNGGVHVTDVTNASRTQLMDLADPAMGRRDSGDFDIPRLDAAEDRSSSEVYGKATLRPDQGRRHRRRSRRPAGCAVRPGLLQARRSQEHLRHRLLHADEHRERSFPPSCGLLTTLGYKIGDKPAVYALEGSIAITGALVQWLRDNLDSSRRAPTSSRSPPPSTTMAASILFRLSPAFMRRTGRTAPAA